MRENRMLDTECPLCKNKTLRCYVMMLPDYYEEEIGMFQFRVMCESEGCDFDKFCPETPYIGDMKTSVIFAIATDMIMRRKF